MQIRPAQPADAEVAAILLYSAYTHTPVTYPLPEARDAYEHGWIARLHDYFRQDGNRFSYQNTRVAVENSEVVGLVLSFGGRDEARLNAAVGSWLEREAVDDEWYVDALAVFKNRQRQGIGTRLLRDAEREARQRHYPKIALHVAPGNKAALELYAHRGYVATEQTNLYGRHYVGMVKTLDDGKQESDELEAK